MGGHRTRVKVPPFSRLQMLCLYNAAGLPLTATEQRILVEADRLDETLMEMWEARIARDGVM